MSTTSLWDHEEPVRDLGIDVPAWIDPEIDGATVAAIIQGGCASGAYMPAVTYHEALATMNEYGDEILDYIENVYGYVPELSPASGSWAGIACDIVSSAVDLWAASVKDEIADALADDDDDA